MNYSNIIQWITYFKPFKFNSYLKISFIFKHLSLIFFNVIHQFSILFYLTFCYQTLFMFQDEIKDTRHEKWYKYRMTSPTHLYKFQSLKSILFEIILIFII